MTQFQALKHFFGETEKMQSGGGVNVIHLIDSDLVVLDVTREIIDSAGFKSLAFDSATAYLEYVNSAAFIPATAIITCYIMPGMDGYKLVREVRKKYPLQKALILSGSPTNDIPPAKENLVCLHLCKPYQPEALFAALKTLNLCERTCTKDKTNGIFKQDCKFGFDHACPFYAALPE